MDAVIVGELLLLGAATGVVAGLTGVGGGMAMAPFPTLLFRSRGCPTDILLKRAIAT